MRKTMRGWRSGLAQLGQVGTVAAVSRLYMLQSLTAFVGPTMAFSFEFNQTASNGKYDAIGALQHEFTEVMGHVGSVGVAVGAGVYTPLDLFRSPSTNNANPSSGTPERALTQQGANTGYFSIDGGTPIWATTIRRTARWITPIGAATWALTLRRRQCEHNASDVGNDAIELASIGWDLTSNGTTLAQSATNKPLV